MKQEFLMVCLWLVVAQRANADFIRIDQQLTTPNLLVFDIGWDQLGNQTVPGENVVLDPNGYLLWKASLKDQFPTSLRLIDVDVLMQDPLSPSHQVRDSWSFFYDDQRQFDRLNWSQWDEQRQSGDRVPPAPWEGVDATFTLLDPYNARVTYAVPEPSVLAIAALFGTMWFFRTKGSKQGRF
jgi:hypothetical protein